MKLEWVNSFKHLFHSSLNTIHCNVHAKQKVIQQETQLSLTNRATHLCNIQWRGWPLNTPGHPHTSKCVGINIEERRKFWSAWAPSPWDRKVAVPLENAPFQHVLPCRIYSFRSNAKSVITEIRLQNLTPRVLPFKVTQGRWNWQGSIGYPWLSINVL